MELYIYEGDRLAKVQVSPDFQTVRGEHYILEHYEGKFYDAEGREIDKETYLSPEEKLRLFARSIPVAEKPKATKEGYLLRAKYFEGGIVWEYVPDPDYRKIGSGTYVDPIAYVMGMEVTAGLWYTDGASIWEAVRGGVPDGFADETYFDIVSGD